MKADYFLGGGLSGFLCNPGESTELLTFSPICLLLLGGCLESAKKKPPSNFYLPPLGGLTLLLTDGESTECFVHSLLDLGNFCFPSVLFAKGRVWSCLVVLFHLPMSKYSITILTNKSLILLSY